MRYLTLLLLLVPQRLGSDHLLSFVTQFFEETQRPGIIFRLFESLQSTVEQSVADFATV